MPILTVELSSKRLHVKSSKRLRVKSSKRLHGESAKRLHMEAMIALLYIIVSLFTGFRGVTGFPGFTGDCAYARNLSGPEYQIKAAFIYNFAKFVEWPQTVFENDSDSIIICIAPNNDPDSDVFFSLNNKTVGGKKIKVRICDNIKDIGDCQILFLDSTNPKFIQDVLRTVKDRSILTVGHIKGFTQEGPIINFFIKDGKLRFEVNLDAARRTGIKLGSQILVSAENIIEEHNY